MSYQEPFEDFQKKWLKRLADSIGAEEGRETYALRRERDLANAKLDKIKKIIVKFLLLLDSGSTEEEMGKTLEELRSIAS